MKDPQPLVCKSEDSIYHLCQRHRLPFFHVGRGGGRHALLGENQSVAHLCLALRVPMDCTHQTPLSLGFSRQGYWNRFPFPTPGDLPNPGIEPTSCALAGRFFTTGPPTSYKRRCQYRNLSSSYLMFPKDTLCAED